MLKRTESNPRVFFGQLLQSLMVKHAFCSFVMEFNKISFGLVFVLQ